MFPGPTEFRLIGYSIESIWTQKSKSNMLTPKNQLADTLTKGNFTRDEWNHLVVLVQHYLAISVLPCALKQWRNDLNTVQEKNESQQNQATNDESHCKGAVARMSSSASECPGKRSNGSQESLECES